MIKAASAGLRADHDDALATVAGIDPAGLGWGAGSQMLQRWRLR